MCLAIPGQLEKITEAAPLMRTGEVNFGGIRKAVNLAYTPEAKVGDYVLVHVGFALSTIDDAEAKRMYEYLHQIGEVQEELSRH